MPRNSRRSQQVVVRVGSVRRPTQSSRPGRSTRSRRVQATGRRTRRRAGHRVRAGSSIVRSFQAALAAPFHPLAMGAMVPGVHAMDSTPHVIRALVTMSTNSSGQINGLFTGHPAYTYVDCGGGGLSGGVGYYTTSDDIYYTANNNQLSQLFSSFRLVGWGLKIRTLLTPLTATGQLVVVPIPLGGHIPSYGLMQAIGINPALAVDNVCNVKFTSGLISSANLSLSGAKSCTAQALLSSELVFAGRPVGPAQWDFRNCETSINWNGSVYSGADLELDTSADPYTVYPGDLSFQSVNGMQGFLVIGSGFPASNQCLEVEIIAHLEVIPFAQNINGVAASSASVDRGSTVDRDRVVAGVTTPQLTLGNLLSDYILPGFRAGARALRAYSAFTGPGPAGGDYLLTDL